MVSLQLEVYQHLKDGKPPKKILSDLDRSMQEILEKSLPDYEKIELYNEALQKSRLFTRKSVPDPLPVKVIKDIERVEEKELLKKIPKKSVSREVFQKNARHQEFRLGQPGAFIG